MIIRFKKQNIKPRYHTNPDGMAVFFKYKANTLNPDGIAVFFKYKANTLVISYHWAPALIRKHDAKYIPPHHWKQKRGGHPQAPWETIINPPP
jgi:hypothetical protein